MCKRKILITLKIIIQVFMILQIFIGIRFIIKNMNYVPEYGDTIEFLQISQTLDIPSYRPFIYPYMLNLSSKIANLINTNITYIIYFLQMIINLGACFILIKTIRQFLDIKLSRIETILYTLFVFFIPFNLHFNMSIKCDSLSTSFTLIFICYLMKYLKEEKYRYAIYTLIAMFLASNIRSEKIYFLSFILIVIILIESILHIYNKKKGKISRSKIKKILILFAILIVGTVSTNISSRILQNSSTETNQTAFYLYLYERVIGDTLPDLYEYLPDNVKETISYEIAQESASSKNKNKIPYEILLKEDGNMQRINEIFKVAITKNFPNITLNIINDFMKNVFAPYYFIFDTTQGVYDYTLTRMEGEHRLLVDFYTLYFNIIFIFINIYVIVSKVKINKKSKEWIVIILYILVSSGFFSLLTSFNFHIRYAMPVYVFEIAFVTTLFGAKEIGVENDGRKNRYINGNI